MPYIEPGGAIASRYTPYRSMKHRQDRGRRIHNSLQSPCTAGDDGKRADIKRTRATSSNDRDWRTFRMARRSRLAIMLSRIMSFILSETIGDNPAMRTA